MAKAKPLIVAAVLGVFLFPVFARAQEEKGAVTCDLPGCIEIALTKHPGLRASQASTEIYKARLDYTKATFMPRFDLTGSIGALTGRPVSPFALVRGVTEEQVDARKWRTGAYYTAGLGFNIPLYYEGAFIGGKTSSVKQAEKMLSAETFAQQAAVRNVINDVTDAFFGVLNCREDLRIATKNLEYQKLRNEIALKRFDMEMIPRSEFLQEVSNLSSTEAAFYIAQKNLSLSVSRLAFSMGLPPGTNVAIRDTSEEGTAIDAANVESLIRIASQNRPEIQEQRSKVESEKEGLQRAKKEWLPIMDVFSAYNYGDNFQLPVNMNWHAMLQMRYELVDFGARKAKLNEATASVHMEENNLIQLKQSIAQEVIQACTDLELARNQIASLEKQADLAREQLAAVKERFKQNLSPEVDVVGAEASVVKSEADLSKARYAVRQKNAKLKQVVCLE